MSSHVWFYFSLSGPSGKGRAYWSWWNYRNQGKYGQTNSPTSPDHNFYEGNHKTYIHTHNIIKVKQYAIVSSRLFFLFAPHRFWDYGLYLRECYFRAASSAFFPAFPLSFLQGSLGVTGKQGPEGREGDKVPSSLSESSKKETHAYLRQMEAIDLYFLSTVCPVSPSSVQGQGGAPGFSGDHGERGYNVSCSISPFIPLSIDPFSCKTCFSLSPIVNVAFISSACATLTFFSFYRVILERQVAEGILVLRYESMKTPRNPMFIFKNQVQRIHHWKHLNNTFISVAWPHSFICLPPKNSDSIQWKIKVLLIYI